MTINGAIGALDAARSDVMTALTHWNALVAAHGEDSPEARAFDTSNLQPAFKACSNAENALLEVEAGTPEEFLRKFTAYLDDGGSTCGDDFDGRLMKNAKRLLDVA